jgi:hypothetical protein
MCKIVNATLYLDRKVEREGTMQFYRQRASALSSQEGMMRTLISQRRCP